MMVRRYPTLGIVLYFDQFEGLLILLVVGVTFLVNRALRMKVAIGQGWSRIEEHGQWISYR